MMRSALRMMTVWFGILLLVGGFAGAWASARAAHHEATPGASPMAATGTGTGAVYLTVANGGNGADCLLGGSTDVARVIEIHDMAIEGGVMRMIPLPDGLEIPAGGSVALEPQGYHVMLIDLTRDLRPGDRFDLTLRFQRAGEVVVPVMVGSGVPEGEPGVTAGDITVSGAWSRPAPMLTAGAAGTPVATPRH
jgi:copper(I)-binding protein